MTNPPVFVILWYKAEGIDNLKGYRDPAEFVKSLSKPRKVKNHLSHPVIAADDALAEYNFYHYLLLSVGPFSSGWFRR